MKRIISFIFAAIIILALPLNALADSPKYAIDGAGLMDESEVSELEEMLASLSEKYNFDIVALTVDSTEGKSPMDFADDYYDYNGYKDDGCLFLISMEERDWWISTKGYGITAITDYGIEVIEAEVVPFLSNGDSSAIRKMLLENCNLHTILDLPSGVFTGAGVKTVVLFFTKGEPTEKI